MRRKSWYLSLYFAVILVLSLLLSLSFNSGVCLADNWTKTAGAGLRPATTLSASSMAKLGSVLYTGTRQFDAGAQLWKNTGSGWTKAGDGGFGNSNNLGVSSMVDVQLQTLPWDLEHGRTAAWSTATTGARSSRSTTPGSINVSKPLELRCPLNGRL